MDTGSYALLMENRRCSSILVGALGEVEFKRGFYVYIGSAFGPGGVDARVRREHEWALALSALPQFQIPVPGFGSSDCNCVSHLFHAFQRPVRHYLPCPAQSVLLP